MALDGLLVIEHLQPDVPAADPRGGFALLSPEGEPTALHRAVREAVAAPQVAHPGLSGDPSTHLVHVADMPLTQLRFWGTGVEVEVERGRESGALVVLRAGAEDVLVGLEGAPGEAQRVRLAAGLPLQEHLVQIRGTPAQLAAIRAVRVTRAAPAWGLWLRLGAGVLLLGWSAVGVAGALRYLPVLAAWRGVRGLGERLPAATRPALLGAALAAVVFLPDARLRLAALAGYGGLALLWPTPALYAAVLAVPLAPVMVHLGVGTFSLAEITLLVAAAAQGWNALLRPWAEIRSAARRARAGLVALDVAVGLLVLVALGATVRAEYQRVAWRESRVVIAESAILYALVRTQTEAVRRRLLEVLVAGVVGVALFGLVRYASPAGVIEAEGVRRARAFYGSPNNLALVLERVWPLALALALWGGGRVRRWLYGAAGADGRAPRPHLFPRRAPPVPAAMLALALLRATDDVAPRGRGARRHRASGRRARSGAVRLLADPPRARRSCASACGARPGRWRTTTRSGAWGRTTFSTTMAIISSPAPRWIPSSPTPITYSSISGCAWGRAARRFSWCSWRGTRVGPGASYVRRPDRGTGRWPPASPRGWPPRWPTARPTPSFSCPNSPCGACSPWAGWPARVAGAARRPRQRESL